MVRRDVPVFRPHAEAVGVAVDDRLDLPQLLDDRFRQRQPAVVVLRGADSRRGSPLLGPPPDRRPASRRGTLPLMARRTLLIIGIFAAPPTNRMRSILSHVNSAFFTRFSVASRVLSSSPPDICSNWSRSARGGAPAERGRIPPRPPRNRSVRSWRPRPALQPLAELASVGVASTELRHELADQVLGDPLVTILAAQFHFAVGRQRAEPVARRSTSVTSNVPPPGRTPGPSSGRREPQGTASAPFGLLRLDRGVRQAPRPSAG